MLVLPPNLSNAIFFSFMTEFWEHHFSCKYPNSSRTPYNENYKTLCTGEEKLTPENTPFEAQLQYVSDAVMAFAWALKYVIIKDYTNWQNFLHVNSSIYRYNPPIWNHTLKPAVKPSSSSSSVYLIFLHHPMSDTVCRKATTSLPDLSTYVHHEDDETLDAFLITIS